MKLPAGLGLAGSLLLGGWAGEADAADAEGRYGVRGVGLITCALYRQQRQAKSAIPLMASAWIDGYLSGVNQYRAGTYDSLSFESTELLAAILDRHCGHHPEDRLFPVMRRLLERLSEDRLREPSARREVVVGDKRVSLYVEVIARLQRRLAAGGHFQGDADGRYTPETQAALAAYPRSVRLDGTGFPDQLTLWRLFREPAAAGGP